MAFLRFLMLLSLIVWLGGVIFFAVLAPTLFSVLPTRNLAGSVVAPMLTKLHWMGIVSGITFLISSMIYSRSTTGVAQPFALRHLLIYAMLALTLISQFGISPKMAALRASMGDIDSVAITKCRWQLKPESLLRRRLEPAFAGCAATLGLMDY